MPVYRLVFNGYLIFVLADNVRLCHRYASAPGDRERSVSLAVIGWGSAICLGYPLSRVTYVLTEASTGRDAELLQSAGSAAATTGLCALAAGVLAPRALASARRWLAAVDGIRQLEPLWHDLTQAFPLLALPTPAPVTLTRAELRHDRHLLEVAEALARARVGSSRSWRLGASRRPPRHWRQAATAGPTRTAPRQLTCCPRHPARRTSAPSCSRSRWHTGSRWVTTEKRQRGPAREPG